MELFEEESVQKEKKTKKIQNCFGDYEKTSIFAPAIEKRWRDSSAG